MILAIVIARRELRQNLVQSLRAYIVMAAFLLLAGSFFFAYLVDTGFDRTSIAGFVQAAQILDMLFAAIVTMNLFAEERRSGTHELLLSSPIRDGEIVAGKFVGCLAIYAVMLGLTLFYPLLLWLFGDPDAGVIATSYVGLLLLGGLCLAVGVFAASLGRNAISSAVICLTVLLGLYYLGNVSAALPADAAAMVARFSLPARFGSFAEGRIDSADVIYHLTLCGTFLFFAAQQVARERLR